MKLINDGSMDVISLLPTSLVYDETKKKIVINMKKKTTKLPQTSKAALCNQKARWNSAT